MKYKYNFSPVLHNRFILYFFFLMAIIDVVYFMNTSDIRSVIVLILIGLLTSFFSKNMIVILMISLTITHIIKYGIQSTYEGATNMSESDNVGDSSGNVVSATKTDGPAATSSGAPSKAELMKELAALQKDQPKIAEKIEGLEPSLLKAKEFIEKFEQYKGVSGLSEMMQNPKGLEAMKSALENFKGGRH